MKILLIILFVFLLYSALYSQPKAIPGIKGGMNYSRLDISNKNVSGKTGYHGGAFVLFSFEKFGVQPEFIFSRQGSVVDQKDWDFKYILVPIMLKYYFTSVFTVQAGPQLGFLNKAERSGMDITHFLKKTDIYLGLGIGWEAPSRICFDARYNLGLTDNNIDLDFETVKNQVFQLSIGLKLIKT